jgi:hypothetical protein
MGTTPVSPVLRQEDLFSAAQSTCIVYHGWGQIQGKGPWFEAADIGLVVSERNEAVDDARTKEGPPNGILESIKLISYKHH